MLLCYRTTDIQTFKKALQNIGRNHLAVKSETYIGAAK